MLAGTARGGRAARAIAGLVASFVLTVVFVARWGAVGLMPPLLLVALLMTAGREVFAARDRLWRTATLPLHDARQRPDAGADTAFDAPTTVALKRLATAV